LIDHEAEQVEQLQVEETPVISPPTPVAYPQILIWGLWPEESLQPLRLALDAESDAVYWQEIDAITETEPLLEKLHDLPDDQLLLLCKGWEPPTGELADFCLQLAERRSHLFLWPIPLTGMSEARQLSLLGSWQAFMQQLPEQFHLLTRELPPQARSTDNREAHNHD
ncbi:MAG: hypothetical protein MI754_15960, partial [Chromatiales bacterium]|nr:hypothetical protein [Chromatiales bacterium]